VRRAAGLLLCLACTEPAPPAPVPVARGLLGATHDAMLRRIGGHRMLAHSRLRVSDGRDLVEDWTLEADGRGNYHLEHTNNLELGKEVVFLDGVLYTRHRFGTFLDRGTDRETAARLREEAWAVLGAYLEVLAPWLDSRRDGDRLTLARAPSRRAIALEDENFPERQWRKTVEVQALEGWVLLDGDVPTDAELRARYSFVRDGKTARTDVEYTRYLTRGALQVARPDAIPTPTRRRIEPDRRRLLGDAPAGLSGPPGSPGAPGARP
jgi:hypothetical protein